MSSRQSRWHGRPGLARLVRVLVFVGPLLASFVTGIVVDRLLPRFGTTLVPAVLRWLCVVIVATVALIVADRFARRALPLAALLRMTMVFPDEAPSRYKVARRTAGVRNLEQRIRDARTTGLSDDPTTAAEEILALVTALSEHDARTRGHSERTHLLTDMLAAELKLPEADRDRLRWAAMVHDIGKLEVSSDTLNAPGRPTEEQWEELRSHPHHGARICQPLAEWLGPWYDAIGQHHERWDGTGYPHGLAGTDISYGARIVAVADAYEVITATRAYKKASSPEEARAELVRSSGSQFDPAIVRAFLNISLGRLRLARGPLSWLSHAPLLERAGQVVEQVPRLAQLTVGSTAAVSTAAAAGLAPGLQAPPTTAEALAQTTPAIVAEHTETPTEIEVETPPHSPDIGAARPTPPTPAAAQPMPPEQAPRPPVSRPTPRPTQAPAPAPQAVQRPAAPPVRVRPDQAPSPTGPTPLSLDATTEEDVPVTIALPDDGLLPLDVTVTSPPEIGSVVVGVDGQVVYTPSPDQSGSDRFVIRRCDTTGACATGEILVRVVPVNDPPAAADDAASVTAGAAVEIPVRANDSDPDHAAEDLVVAVISGPSVGQTLISGGVARYIAASHYAGEAVFRYSLCDPLAACDTATVRITVSGQPAPPPPAPSREAAPAEVDLDRGEQARPFVIPPLPTPGPPGGTPPGQGGTPPGQGGGTPPGQGGGTPPGQGGGTPPGQDGSTPPGQSGTPPGQDGSTPPGQDGGTPPGQDDTTPPGQDGGTPPGQDGGTPPGQGDTTPPGQDGPPPGQDGGTPPGPVTRPTPGPPQSTSPSGPAAPAAALPDATPPPAPTESTRRSWSHRGTSPRPRRRLSGRRLDD